MSNGKIIGIVGDMGAGKTSFIKKRFASNLKNKGIICYATMETDFFDNEKIVVYTNFMQLVDKANGETDILILVDEAFTCLPKKISVSLTNPKHPYNRLTKFLVDSRKANRFVVFLFHAYSQVPEWLIMYLDFMVRFRTNDLIQYQAQRLKSFPNIANNLLEVPVVKDFQPEILKLR